MNLVIFLCFLTFSLATSYNRSASITRNSGGGYKRLRQESPVERDALVTELFQEDLLKGDAPNPAVRKRTRKSEYIPERLQTFYNRGIIIDHADADNEDAEYSSIAASLQKRKQKRAPQDSKTAELRDQQKKRWERLAEWGSIVATSTLQQWNNESNNKSWISDGDYELMYYVMESADHEVLLNEEEFAQFLSLANKFKATAMFYHTARELISSKSCLAPAELFSIFQLRNGYLISEIADEMQEYSNNSITIIDRIIYLNGFMMEEQIKFEELNNATTLLANIHQCFNGISISDININSKNIANIKRFIGMNFTTIIFDSCTIDSEVAQDLNLSSNISLRIFHWINCENGDAIIPILCSLPNSLSELDLTNTTFQDADENFVDNLKSELVLPKFFMLPGEFESYLRLREEIEAEKTEAEEKNEETETVTEEEDEFTTILGKGYFDEQPYEPKVPSYSKAIKVA